MEGLFRPVEGPLFYMEAACTVSGGAVSVTTDKVVDRPFRRLLWVVATSGIKNLRLKLANDWITEPFTLPIGLLFPVFLPLPTLNNYQFAIVGAPVDAAAEDPMLTLILEEYPRHGS